MAEEKYGGMSGDAKDKQAKGFSEAGLPNKEFWQAHETDVAENLKVPTSAPHKEDKS